MIPLQAYKLYLAVKLHFTQESYDVFENNGALKYSSNEDEFRNNKRFELFLRYAREWTQPQEFVQMTVSTFAFNKNFFDIQEVRSSIQKWTKNKEMMTQLILDDLDQIDSLEDWLKGDPCKLMKKVSGEHINIETAVAINRSIHFIQDWKVNFTHPTLFIRIKKLDKFIKFNEEKVFSRLSEL